MTQAGILLSLCGSVLRAGPADIPTLAEGFTVERQILGGDTQRFRIEAHRGEFVHVVVEQKGADVRLRLLGAGGDALAQSDFPNADWGPEVIALVMDSPGDDTVEVASLDPKAGAGKYELRVVALHDATPADRERAAAEALVGSAEKHRRERTAAARSAAIPEYDQVLPFFEASRELYRQGLILNSSGLICAQLGKPRDALPRFNRAAKLFHDDHAPRQEATVQNNLGGMNDLLGDLETAHESYGRALALYRSVGDRVEEANTLSNIGKLYGDQNEWQKAAGYYQQALEIDQSRGNARHEAFVLNNLGTLYLHLGEYDIARDYLTRAVETSRAFRDAIQGIALYNLGQASLIASRPQEALDHFGRALALYRDLGDKRGEGMALDSVGVATARLDDNAQAIRMLNQSIEALKAVGDVREESVALENAANVYLHNGQAAKALELAQQAIAGFRVVSDRNSQAQAMFSMAQAQRSLGNRDVAMQQAEETLALIEQARAGTAAEQSRASYLASREDAYSFAIDSLMESGRAQAALETSERARARSLIEMLAESRTNIREGVDPVLLDRERDIANRLNARGARLLRSPQSEALQQEIRALEKEYQDVEAAIRARSPRYAALTQPHPLSAAEIEQLTDDDTVILEYSLGETHSYLWVVGKQDLRSFVLPSRAVIERRVDRVCDLLAARSVVVRMEQPAEKRRRIANADAALPSAARELSETILGPAKSMLGLRKLVFVPDGPLQRLPFSMLPDPAGSSEPLIAAHEVVMLPSASVLAILRQETRKPAPKMLAVFADPVFDKTDPRVPRTPEAADAGVPTDSARILEHLSEPAATGNAAITIPRLPFTALEADGILRVASPGPNLKDVGFDATRSAALNPQLDDYRYIHFATHGYLDTEQPSLSALVLSQIDHNLQPEDGFLRVNDIYNLRLAADLVVLSACQTGLGKEVRGEGLMGLTRAFLYAGAPRVIVSLWNVNDRATADLMVIFYRRMLRDHESPAEALRQAQLELRKQKQWESPYYWAAFVEHGDWR